MPDNDTAVKDDVVADTTVQTPAPEEKKPEVVEDAETALEEVSIDAFDEDETEDAPKEEVVETPVQPQGEEKPLAPKSENRFQQLANENREMREQLSRLKQQESQFATEQELLNEVNPDTGEYYTPQEVERIAFAQSREAQATQVAQERYNLEVQQNQTVIKTEAERALQEFPMFDESNKKEYNPTLAAQADVLLAQSLIFDNGVLVGSNLSPYQLYKTIADSAQTNDSRRQAEAQKATEKMLANADVADGNSQATNTKEDPLLAGFDEEAARR